MTNFTISDVVGSFCGVLFFFPLMTAPGYVAAWFTRVLGFRELSVPWRMLVSVPLSMALSPILSYIAGTAAGWPGVYSLYGLALLLAGVLMTGRFGHENVGVWLSGLRQVPRVAYIVAGVWLAVSLVSLVDLQIGDRLYFSSVAYDHSVRTAITDAITRTGVTPNNPFYYLGASAPLRYHYFWFIGCSLVTQMGSHFISARQAVDASVAWSGWGLAAIIPLYLRFVFGMAGTALRRTSLCALALTLVTGLDLLPVLIYWWRGIVFWNMESWNDQITSWWGSALWVPHHMAALVIGLTALLLVWDAASKPELRERISGAVLIGVALASMLATSVYVALVIFAFLVLWTFASLFLMDRRHTATLLVAGVLTIILATPYLLALIHSTSPATSVGETGGSGLFSFVKPFVRHFYPLDDWTEAHPVGRVTGYVLRLLFLPVSYFLELGVFFIGALLYARRIWSARPWDLHVIYTGLLALTSIFICTFLHSSVISNNDLGWRGFLPAQFVLLLWTAELLSSRQAQSAAAGNSRGSWLRSPLWAPLIVIGALGTVYELNLLRFDGLLADEGIVPLAFSPDRQFGLRTYALRTAYAKLNEIFPRSEIIQNSPEGRYTDFFYGLYANRQTAAYDPTCGAQFGGSLTKCEQLYPEIAAVFSNKGDQSPAHVTEVFKRLYVSAVLVKDLDPSWKDRSSWVWQLTPVIANDYVRIYLFPIDSVTR